MLDLQCEIVEIVETILAPLDHFDLVIKAFRATVVVRIIAMNKRAIGIVIERLCEFPQRLNATLFRSLGPLGEKEDRFVALLGIPQTLQIVLEHINRIEFWFYPLVLQM